MDSRPDRLGDIIAARIRHHRENSGLTQVQLSVGAGVSLSWVSRVELGTSDTSPRIHDLARVADILGVTLADLILDPAP